MFPTWEIIFPLKDEASSLTPPPSSRPIAPRNGARAGVTATNGDVRVLSPGSDGDGGSVGDESLTKSLAIEESSAGEKEERENVSGRSLRRREYKGDVGLDRGLGVVIFCFFSSTAMEALYDFLAWQWWRKAFLTDG